MEVRQFLISDVRSTPMSTEQFGLDQPRKSARAPDESTQQQATDTDTDDPSSDPKYHYQPQSLI